MIGTKHGVGLGIGLCASAGALVGLCIGLEVVARIRPKSEGEAIEYDPDDLDHTACSAHHICIGGAVHEL